MRYIIREIYYFLVKIYKIISCKKIKLCFRTKVSKNSIFEGFNKIDHHSYFNGEIGVGSYIGEYSNISGKVGRYCSIGGHVNVLTSTHPVRKFVSTCPSFYSTKKQNGFSFVKSNKFLEEKKVGDTKFPIIIGNDVYIGFGVILIAPVVIGDGAVIAAGSVVTKNVEPYSIVGGNPAKVIRYRFDDEEIKKLKYIKWWNKDKSWIRENIDLFDDIKDFSSTINS